MLRANANYLALFGYTEAEVIGQHHSLFCSPEVADSLGYQAFWAALREGEFRGGEFPRVTKSGQPIYLQGTYNPVLDLQGQPVSVVKFAQDITDTKLHALEMRAWIDAINTTQAVIEFSPDGTVAVLPALTRVQVWGTALAFHLAHRRRRRAVPRGVARGRGHDPGLRRGGDPGRRRWWAGRFRRRRVRFRRGG